MSERLRGLLAWGLLWGWGLALLSGCGMSTAAAPPLVVGGLYNLSGAMAPYDTPVEQGRAAGRQATERRRGHPRAGD